ncbi:MAG: hypothetical protein Q8920_03130 [Bacillota bacterium]|nr:hypothetical protein [Bacillota bacterium]
MPKIPVFIIILTVMFTTAFSGCSHNKNNTKDYSMHKAENMPVSSDNSKKASLVKVIVKKQMDMTFNKPEDLKVFSSALENGTPIKNIPTELKVPGYFLYYTYSDNQTAEIFLYINQNNGWIYKNGTREAYTLSKESVENLNRILLLYKEEAKRTDLYTAVMKAAFRKENGGNGFIAIEKESLKELKEESKEYILEAFNDISYNLYWFEDVKDNNILFKLDKNGDILGTINGTVLSINLKEYKNDEAIITVTSWFGNLGAVFPEYKAVYKDGLWQLELISIAVS